MKIVIKNRQVGKELIQKYEQCNTSICAAVLNATKVTISLSFLDVTIHHEYYRYVFLWFAIILSSPIQTYFTGANADGRL